MAKQLFLNNFTTVFIAAVKQTPTTGTPATELDYGVLRVSDGAAGMLLNPTGGDYYVLTAYKRSGSTESNIEVMRVTAVDNSTPGECRITVQRAQEGTTAQAYVSGDYLSLRFTKGSAENLVQKVAGKDLSTEDYTTAEKTKLAGVAAGAQVNTVTSVAGKTGEVTLAKGDVGLGSVDNTSDANKPVSTATQNALNLKANLASPTFTGTVVANSSSASTGISALSGGNSGFESKAQGSGGTAGAATIAFHRPSAHAVHFGLDTDNKLKVGGWSLGANAYAIYHEGNDGAGSGLDADLLDGQDGSFYQNASNLTTGTVPEPRLPALPISKVTGLQNALDGKAPTATPTITGLREVRAALPADNIDLATGNVFTKTISGATTLTVSNIPAVGTTASFILDLTNGGSAAITWWAGMKWAGGTVPTLTAAGRDVLGFFTHDGGTTWTGLVLGKDVK